MNAFKFEYNEEERYITIKPKCWIGHLQSTYASGSYECLKLIVKLPTNSYREYFENCEPISHHLYIDNRLVLAIYLYPPWCYSKRVIVKDDYKLLKRFRYVIDKSGEERRCAWSESRKRCVCRSGASGWILYYFVLEIYDKYIGV